MTRDTSGEMTEPPQGGMTRDRDFFRQIFHSLQSEGMRVPDIPQSILQNSFPNQKGTIIELIAFVLPHTTNNLTIDIHISQEQPGASNEDVDMLLSTPVPSAAMVKDLLDCIQSVSPQRARSVAIPDRLARIKYFPLWVVTYWKEISSVADQRTSWLEANQNLQRLRTTGAEMEELVDRVYEVLGRMPWFGSVLGFIDNCDIVYLHWLTSTSWLTTAHQDLMLNLLRLMSANTTRSDATCYQTGGVC